MKQKQDESEFDNSERKKYRSQWEHTASQETAEHALKVNSMHADRVRQQQVFQRAQKEALDAQMKLSKANDREVQQKFDVTKFEEEKQEKQMMSEKKRQMQEINKQVWLDQIALNRKHKKLNL